MTEWNELERRRGYEEQISSSPLSQTSSPGRLEGRMQALSDGAHSDAAGGVALAFILLVVVVTFLVVAAWLLTAALPVLLASAAVAALANASYGRVTIVLLAAAGLNFILFRMVGNVAMGPLSALVICALLVAWTSAVCAVVVQAGSQRRALGLVLTLLAAPICSLGSAASVHAALKNDLSGAIIRGLGVKKDWRRAAPPPAFGRWTLGYPCDVTRALRRLSSAQDIIDEFGHLEDVNQRNAMQIAALTILAESIVELRESAPTYEISQLAAGRFAEFRNATYHHGERTGVSSGEVSQFSKSAFFRWRVLEKAWPISTVSLGYFVTCPRPMADTSSARSKTSMMEEYAERVCACLDMSCKVNVDREYYASVRGAAASATPDEIFRIHAARRRMLGCAKKMTGSMHGVYVEDPASQIHVREPPRVKGREKPKVDE